MRPDAFQTSKINSTQENSRNSWLNDIGSGSVRIHTRPQNRKLKNYCVFVFPKWKNDLLRKMRRNMKEGKKTRRKDENREKIDFICNQHSKENENELHWPGQQNIKGTMGEGRGRRKNEGKTV